MYNYSWQLYLSHVWHISQVWHTWNVSHCDTMWHSVTKSSKMPWKAKIRQLGNKTDVTHRDTMWYCVTSVTLNVIRIIRPSNDGRRHGTVPPTCFLCTVWCAAMSDEKNGANNLASTLFSIIPKIRKKNGIPFTLRLNPLVRPTRQPRIRLQLAA
jgi:hypothetical protein